MSEHSSTIISKVWGMCGPLRDDGVSYGDYLEQLTYLIFLKMSDEYAHPPYKRETGIPAGYTWSDMCTLKGAELEKKYKEILEKKNMGFAMSRWDEKLLKYGALFEKELMDLSVNLSLEDSLDLGWRILADCFTKEETGIKSALADEFWPKA